ncbi:MAG TPA: TonB-dependent receptor, partial [Burkholderiales bacterium]|nr:TonB-dependent receptor [Burkholderiales bacterium]
QVARTSASGYAISSRGFNNSNGLANKLLVLIDGRTVYSPVMSGVFWDQQDVMLEDVERIEVISGPGATLWGANAVNGVINVITRTAANTQGALLTGGLGNRDKGGGIRYGGEAWAGGRYRIYGKSFDVNNTERANGTSVTDGWQRGSAGFRADWDTANRTITLQGDAYSGKSENRAVGGPVETSGSNLLARWSQRFDSGSDIRVQAYYDNAQRIDRTSFQGDTDVFDFEFQHGIPFDRHKLMWGAGYRHSSDNIPATIQTGPVSVILSFVPQGRVLTWQNLFVQDEYKLTEHLELTAGIKMESNDYTGWEYLPSARLAWKPADNSLVWGAVSRAVRAPARLDREFHLDVRVPALNRSVPVIQGGPYFVSEVAKVYEIGYRAQPTQALSYSITAFHQDYEKLRSGQPAPAFIENRISGFENGIEAWGTLQVTQDWRLMAGTSTLHKHLAVEPGSTDPVGPVALGIDPNQQWVFRSSLNLKGGQEFDVIARRVGSLVVQPNPLPRPAVPAYTAIDLRWGWKVSRTLDVSLTLTNINDPEHPEFDTVSFYGRGAFLKFEWRPQ